MGHVYVYSQIRWCLAWELLHPLWSTYDYFLSRVETYMMINKIYRACPI